MRPHRLKAALLAPLLLFASPRAAAERAYGPDLNGRVFDRAWSEVERRYWDPALKGLNWNAMRDRFRPQALAARDARTLYAVLNAMLDQIGDSHVFATNPALIAKERAREAGRTLAGFGLSCWQEGKSWRVDALREGSPAKQAGIQIGWELLSVNGGPIDLGSSPADGELTTFLFRDEEGNQRSFNLRATLLPPEPDRRALRLPGGVLLLAFDSFDDHVDRWIADQIAAGPAPSAVILDLRRNSGGEAMTVARVAGRFFSKKRTLLRRFERDEAMDLPILGARRSAYAGPMAVLVGPESASGAEIIAALFEESGRAITVGERTSGALTGAAISSLPDGGELTVAVFDIRTPAGRRIEGQGFTPRIRVTPTLTERRAGQDPALARAMELLPLQASTTAIATR